MFDADDLVPCGQCDDLVKFNTLDDQNICPECQYDNSLVKKAIGNEFDWTDRVPVIRSTNITFSS